MKLILKFSSLLFLSCLLFQNSYSQQNMNGWYWINGQPQSNDLSWVKILDATHYYAVGENGTFMKSSDGGDSWLINSQAGVTDPSFGSGATLRLYSAWFFDVNTGFVTGQSATNDGGKIRKTTDGGQTFSSIGLGIPAGVTFMPPRVYDINFINSNTGYICGDTVVKCMMTTNGGSNWTLMPNLPAVKYNYNCIYAVDANNIYLGVESAGLYRKIVWTSNGGATWIDQNLPGTSIYDIKDIEFQDANTGFVCGSGSSTNASYFAFTTNAGISWTQAVYPNINYGLKDLKIVGSTVYTLGDYQTYYYTSDLGVTWNSVYFSDPTNINQPADFIVYAFDKNGNDEIVVGISGKINVSNDNGSTWRNKNYAVGNSEYCFSSILAYPGTQKVWAGSNGGGRIFYSDNRGTNWTMSQTDAIGAFYKMDMINTSTGYAAGGILNPGVGYCYKTTNGGVNWSNTATLPTPGMPRYGIKFVNANTGWVFGGYPFASTNQICKTTNGGVSWVSQAFNPPLDLTFGSGDFADANTGYCVSAYVYKTTNGGTNWDYLPSLPTGLGFSKVKVFSASTLYLGGANRIYKSFDGGVTWDSALTPSTAGIFNMDWTDLNNGTVVGTQGYTAKTSDGGLTWTERNTGTSTIAGVSMASKDTVFAACDRNVWAGLFRLYDTQPVATTLNLTIGIEAFWNGINQVSDTVKCHLRSAVSPFGEVEVASAVLNNAGYGSFNFNTPVSGNYYIEITHRNSLETWSAQPVNLTTGGVQNYNFTTSLTQTYGNNCTHIFGRYCDYSGDVNQDGAINLGDIVQTFNASSSFATGYVVTDVNGNSSVDLSDITYVYNNSRAFVAKVTP